MFRKPHPYKDITAPVQARNAAAKRDAHWDYSLLLPASLFILQFKAAGDNWVHHCCSYWFALFLCMVMLMVILMVLWNKLHSLSTHFYKMGWMVRFVCIKPIGDKWRIRICKIRFYLLILLLLQVRSAFLSINVADAPSDRAKLEIVVQLTKWHLLFVHACFNVYSSGYCNALHFKLMETYLGFNTMHAVM